MPEPTDPRVEAAAKSAAADHYWGMLNPDGRAYWIANVQKHSDHLNAIDGRDEAAYEHTCGFSQCGYCKPITRRAGAKAVDGRDEEIERLNTEVEYVQTQFMEAYNLRMRYRCELATLRAENERLREALGVIAETSHIGDAVPQVRQLARAALAPTTTEQQEK